eukprot:7812246-Alexandrium_andersonii.AAC.1
MGGPGGGRPPGQAQEARRKRCNRFVATLWASVDQVLLVARNCTVAGGVCDGAGAGAGWVLALQVSLVLVPHRPRWHWFGACAGIGAGIGASAQVSHLALRAP